MVSTLHIQKKRNCKIAVGNGQLSLLESLLHQIICCIYVRIILYCTCVMSTDPLTSYTVPNAPDPNSSPNSSADSGTIIRRAWLGATLGGSRVSWGWRERGGGGGGGEGRGGINSVQCCYTWLRRWNFKRFQIKSVLTTTYLTLHTINYDMSLSSE